jgi:preprotein translocase subunit SecG
VVFFLVLHVIVSILLVITILMQSGKGGGLAEGFSSAENLLGAQTNTVMVKITGVLTALFLGLSLLLAVLSSQKDRSLIEALPDVKTKTVVNIDQLFNQEPSQTIQINAALPEPEVGLQEAVKLSGNEAHALINAAVE